MTDSTDLIRVPQGALASTATAGFLYEPTEVPRQVEAGNVVLVVSDDGYLRGITPHDRAPLTAVLRLETDLADIVDRLDELADRAAGLDTGTAVEVAMLKGRVRRLEEHSRR